MAKNFLAGPTLKAQGSRNGFDVSYQNQFTAPFGMLLPCFFQRVNPDDKVDIALESQTICDGLARPAFMRLKEHVDYYFIPTTQLWMPFDNFVTGQNSYFSSSVKNVNDGKVPQLVPTFVPQALSFYVNEWNTNKKDELGYDFFEGAKRLLDGLGYWNLSNMSWTEVKDLFANDSTSRFNLFPLLCYQKVYYDFYRNPKYEDNDVSAYNLDDLASGFTISDLGDIGDRFAKFLSIHYRWQKKDYFTQVQPSNLVTSADYGYTDLPTTAIASFLNVPGIPQAIQNSVSASQSAGVNLGAAVNIGRTGTVPVSNVTNVAAIRFAFAYDRLLRRMRQAGPDFDNQMLAQFGVKPFDARHGKCTYLGGYTNNLSSKDVTNMTGDNIGDLAGQINVYSDNTKRHLHFHAKEHGYIIGIYSTSVENMYQSFRSSRETMLMSRFDWFNPAFENLGLQPVFQAEYDYTDEQAAIREKSWRPQSRTSILGYVPRYSELKTRVDECHGLLCNYANVVGFKEWNVQVNTSIQRVGDAFAKPMLQLNPSQFDSVSGIAYNGTQFTDHFVVNMFTHSKKVSSMTMYEEF